MDHWMQPDRASVEDGRSQERIELALESLCGQGCKAVWGIIASLESGQALPQTNGLSAYELETLLAELKAIMAVYAGTCGA
jgi:hypothetical protein